MDRTYAVSRSQKSEVRSQKNKNLSSVICHLSSENEGITLIELLIAAFLVGLVGIAVTSVDISARRFMFSAQQDTGVQNEAGPAIEHIVNNIKYGWDVDAGISGGDMRLCFRVDNDPSGDGIGPFNPDGSPETFSVARYKWDNTGPDANTILFKLDTAADCNTSGGGWTGAGWQQIAKNITICAFNLENTNGDIDSNGNAIYDRLIIKITSQTTSPSGEIKTTNLQSDVALRFTGYRI